MPRWAVSFVFSTLVVLVPVVPGQAVADDASPAGSGRVVEVLRELFPEVESEMTLPGGGGEPIARLRLGLGYDEARARVLDAYSAGRRFGSGATLGGFSDRLRTRDFGGTVHAGGARSVGSFVLSRAGRATVADVFESLGAASTAPLPPRRVLPAPHMRLFPLAPEARR